MTRTATQQVGPAAVTPARGRTGRPQVALLLVVGLHLVTETALTPFLPQLFRSLFGVEDLAATGVFLWVCRVSGCAALPLWGLAARRWPAERLVVTGLTASTLLYAGLVVAPDYPTFTVLAAGAVATNAALLLAYPALVAAYERAGPGGGSRRHLRGVRAYVAVFHAAVVVSTLVGAAVIALPSPRWGLGVFVVLEAALLVVCHRTLGPRALSGRPAVDPPRRRVRAGQLVTVAAVAVVVEAGVNVVRPFFTEYAATGGFGTVAGATWFLLANVAALAVLPLAESAWRRFGRCLLPLALLVAAAGLALQAVDPGPLTLALGRVVFGAGVGLGHLALDLHIFAVTGTAAPAYAVVQTARVSALMLSPLLATFAAAHGLALPLAVGALLCAGGAVLAPLLTADRPTADRTTTDSRTEEASRPWP